MKRRKRKNKGLKIAITTLFLILLALGVMAFVMHINKETLSTKYIASFEYSIKIKDENEEEHIFVRGTQIALSDKQKTIDDVEYFKFYYDDSTFYTTDESIFVNNREDAVLEKELFVYRTCSVYEDESSSKINGLILKGEKIEVIGHSPLKDDGSVDRYQYKDGYLLSKYLTKDENEALSESEYLKYHDVYAYDDTENVKLDFYENEKIVFEDNVMPDIVKAIYVNDAATYEMDDYIALAKEIGANTLVIDIRDSHVVNLKAETMKEYTPSSYEAGKHTKEEFVSFINKCKENNLYTVARITVFKDPNYANDHQDEAIIDLDTNGLFRYGGAFWPSAYSRECWEYNVELAKECISDIGFNEVQFDYVRFPELVGYFNDVLGGIDLRNTYGETRSEAIQRFLIYACDEIHKVHGYVSADVFGETSNKYICDYGQYWPAISNVVDVISAMPYPDHFTGHEFNPNYYSWEVPYDTLYGWGKQAKERQKDIPTPAKVRTWLQGYNSIKEPYVVYDCEKIIDQINGLKNADIYDGFMIWNSLSDYEKFKSYKDAFK